MNANKNNQKQLVSSNGFPMGESPEEIAKNISLIRARESRRPRRTNIDWFSL